MYNFLYFFLLFLFSIFVFIESLSYGLNEIKVEKNKIGGIAFIIFSLFCIVFSNLVVFFKD